LKIAIFVEGQTEAILTRTILECCVRQDDLYIDITTLSRASGSGKPIRSFRDNTSASNHYEIFVAPGDGAVLTSLKDRLPGLLFSGYEPVVGLQDLYGNQYSRLNNGKLDQELTEAFREGAKKQSLAADAKGRVQFSYAEMEVEAWLLSIPELFEAIDSKLTVEFIKASLGYDLRSITPESEFLHPAVEVSRIMKLVGKTYDKHADEVEMIASHISDTMILKLSEGGRAPSFNYFMRAILPGLS
jgi:hypothetical protein